MMDNIKVEMMEHPTARDWLGVKKRALVTVGKEIKKLPSLEWEKSILMARHSPIRYLRFSFYIECPSWVSVHLARHVHAQPYIMSQRNDRQNNYDRNTAPQNAPVRMIWDMNAEELMVIANKRLCMKAAAETRQVVKLMCEAVRCACPEFEDVLVPMCFRENGCHEMDSCGAWDKWNDSKSKTDAEEITDICNKWMVQQPNTQFAVGFNSALGDVIKFIKGAV